MTLTLPGPTSSGTADWPGDPDPAVFTGDAFELITTGVRGGRVNSDFVPGVGCSLVCNFHISWSEIAGQLDAISILEEFPFDDIGGVIPGLPIPGGPFGLTGGGIGSMEDGYLGGCAISNCLVSGFWAIGPLPEPWSIEILIGALTAMFGFMSLRSRCAGAA